MLIISLILAESFVKSKLFILTSPLVGNINVDSILIVVVFPAPFVPKSENNSPDFISRFKLFTAYFSLYFFVRLFIFIIISSEYIICNIFYYLRFY